MAIDKGELKPAPLSAANRTSFAYPTIKDRVPVIICKVIDLLHRYRSERTESEREDLKTAIESMARLRYELLTDKPFKPITDDHVNAKVWNDYLDEVTQEEGKVPTWFSTKWLYAECYAYRRLLESFSTCPNLKSEDFFSIQKKESFFGSQESILLLIKTQSKMLNMLSQKSEDSEALKRSFEFFLKICLWGNKCDLSISSGTSQTFEGDPTEKVRNLEEKIIIDESGEVWNHVRKIQGTPGNNNFHRTCDIVMDNVGFELVSDLVFADFLTSSKLFDQIRLRVKDQPWFVSDAMAKDIDWTIMQLENIQGPNQTEITQIVQRWKTNLQNKTWTVHADPFWSYPQDFSYMCQVDPQLYRTLSEAQLVIFKGDLNYRKLVGDLAWNPLVTFEKSLSDFHPSPLVTLRTLKADVVVGLREGQEKKLLAQDKDFMINGNWGLIQFCEKVRNIN